MDAFVFIPISLYLIFTGLFLQHGITNVFMESGELVPKRQYLVRFIFASAPLAIIFHEAGSTTSPFIVGLYGVFSWLLMGIAIFWYQNAAKSAS